jgi:hypothetical protein
MLVKHAITWATICFESLTRMVFAKQARVALRNTTAAYIILRMHPHQREYVHINIDRNCTIEIWSKVRTDGQPNIPRRPGRLPLAVHHMVGSGAETIVTRACNTSKLELFAYLFAGSFYGADEPVKTLM